MQSLHASNPYTITQSSNMTTAGKYGDDAWYTSPDGNKHHIYHDGVQWRYFSNHQPVFPSAGNQQSQQTHHQQSHEWRHEMDHLRHDFQQLQRKVDDLETEINLPPHFRKK